MQSGCFADPECFLNLRNAKVTGSHSDDDSSDENEGQGKERSLTSGLPTQEHWRLIGECYDGRMDGEALSDPNYLNMARGFVLV
jgi:hypothetical protein